jgi:hypothetical protein
MSQKSEIFCKNILRTKQTLSKLGSQRLFGAWKVPQFLRVVNRFM